MEIIKDKSVSCVNGFRAAAVAEGFKSHGKLDMGVIVCDEPDAVAAAVFTTNQVKAAPVQVDMKHIKNPTTRALVINSGNANACTGEQGLKDTGAEAAQAAERLGISPDEVLVYSTGVIGVPLPMERISKGIDDCIGELAHGGDLVHRAIMTTDTKEKCIYVRINAGGKNVDICGIAKGSGMIHPNMATMLSYVVTDCNVTKDVLTDMQKKITDDTFNMVTVDGDTSTNDTATIISSRAAGNPVIDSEKSDGYKEFYEAVYYVTEWLSKAIAADGEGAERFMEVHVYNAADKQQARTLARSVAGSNLVKAAIHGSDANWGRVLCAMGYSGAAFDQNTVDVAFESSVGSIDVFIKGVPQPFDEDRALKILKEDRVRISINMNSGSSEAKSWGCDLTEGYVKINGDYRS